MGEPRDHDGGRYRCTASSSSTKQTAASDARQSDQCASLRRAVDLEAARGAHELVERSVIGPGRNDPDGSQRGEGGGDVRLWDGCRGRGGGVFEWGHGSQEKVCPRGLPDPFGLAGGRLASKDEAGRAVAPVADDTDDVDAGRERGPVELDVVAAGLVQP